ncbi:MAG TPA: CU044_5270 family protein [Actinophytocola sp.]|jgi:hypothetical protein|nr:CU044_5270 family protein [Actinophytocola sp.]
MNDDLQTLHAALMPDEPSQDVVDHSRRRLENRIGGLATRKRNRWLAAGTGLTVAAAAAAVVITVVPGAPAPGPTARPPERPESSAPAKPLTGPEILLAAAAVAQRAPDETGTYWYMKETTDYPNRPADVFETWTKPNGQQWWRGFKSFGHIVKDALVIRNPFSLPAATMTLDRLRALPTDPKKLKAAIINAIKHDDVRTSAGLIRDDPKALADFTFDSFISLVSMLPAPPQVRAAAFRAIAAYPGVRSLGPVPGGNGLLLPDGERLVVDPATGRVNGTSVIVTMDGAERYPGVEGSTIRINAEWTDSVPS